MILFDRIKFSINKNKVLFKNFSSLTILQISQYVFPLITFPYITRILGPEKFGLVNFAYLFVAFFTSFIEFGFNISGTQKISIHRNNVSDYSRVFWNVIYSKIILFSTCTIIFLIILFSFQVFAFQKDLYLISYLSVISVVFFPQWFFMGKENMKIIFLINLPIKIMYTLAIFIFITNMDDWKLLVLLNSLTMICIGIVGFLYSIYKYKIQFNSFDFTQIKETIKESSQIFLSLFSISMYSSNSIFLLGLFSSNEILGLFVVADKIRLFMQIIPHSMTEAFFPYVSLFFDKSKKLGFRKLKNYTVIIIFISFFISLFGFIFAEFIITNFVGKNYDGSIYYLKILAWVPFIVALRDTIGKQIMLNLGMKIEFMKIFVYALIFSFILSLIFVPIYFAKGTAVILLLTESFVFIFMLFKTKNELKLNEIF